MAPQWSADEDRALLLSLVQVMAPNGPSKHQFEGARVLLNDRWTLSAITQHYNKKLRPLAPASLEGGASNVATPVRSATKRKAPTPKAAGASASPTPGAEGGRKKKKAASKAVSEEVVAAGDEDDDEESPVKKAKTDESDGEE